MNQLKRRCNALERAERAGERPAYIMLVPDEDGRLIGPDGELWEDEGGAKVIDLDEGVVP